MAKNKNKSNIKNKSMNRSTIKSMCVYQKQGPGTGTHIRERKQIKISEDEKRF